MSDTFEDVRNTADKVIKIPPSPITIRRARPLKIECPKLTLCVKRTQNQKTFVAINRMKDELNKDEIDGRSIHMVHTMNTLAGGTQFAKRLSRDLHALIEKYGPQSVIIFSSKCDIAEFSSQHVRTLDELKGRCLDIDTCPYVVIMCGHKIRYENTRDLLQCVQKNTCAHIKRAFVYYDELHKYINESLRSIIETIHSYDIVHGILALSATPDRIWERSGNSFWTNIRLIWLDNVVSPDYIGYNDMRFNEDVLDYFVEYKRPGLLDAREDDVFNFVEYVLKRFPYYLANGNRVFIPAHIRRESHEKMKNLILELNPQALIVIMNANNKKLVYKDEHGTNVSQELRIGDHDGEVGKAIAELVAEHGLGDRPVVVTGLLCVGMGQTFSHPSWGSFTHAIVSHMDLNNDDIYQLLGRLTGMMRKWPSYVKTEIACPAIIRDRFYAMETCAKKMAEEYNGEVVSHEKYIAPLKDMGDIGQSVINNMPREKKPSGPKRVRNNYDACKFPPPEQFKSLDELLNRLQELKPDANKPKLRMEGGKYVCSLGKGSEVQRADAIRALKGSKYWGQGITNAKDGDIVHRVYVGYEEDGTPTFFLRHTIKK